MFKLSLAIISPKMYVAPPFEQVKHHKVPRLFVGTKNGKVLEGKMVQEVLKFAEKMLRL